MSTSNSKSSRVQGPEEDHDAGWRTTHSHTPKQMMSVYRELFFAGLPKPTNTQRGGAAVSFPPALVKEMFSRFGPITSFHFDVTRGIGAVTYEHGEDAERCFITAHLSLMRGGGGDHNSDNNKVEELDDDDGNSNGSRVSRASGVDGALGSIFGKHAAILYIEFAQWLPFVNPLLLDGSVSALTTMNRQLLRTFPVCERRSTAQTATHVVYNCKAGVIDKNGASISLPGHGTMADLALAVALVQTLLPPSSAALTKSNSDAKITVLDLWGQFYDQYVVAKTQPDPSRIAFPEFRFAMKASSLQSIVQHCKHAVERGDHHGRIVLARFAEDDVLHSTMAYVVLKTRMVHDATHMSLLRDIDARYAKLTDSATASPRTSSCFVSREGRLGLEALLSPTTLPLSKGGSSGVPAAAPAAASPDQQWLQLSLVDAASNAIVNASYMYPTRSNIRLTSEEEEEARFDRVLKLFDEFASSGSAQSMVALCCASDHFKGPAGLPSTLPTMQGMLWRTFRTPLLVVAVLGALLMALLWWPTTFQSPLDDQQDAFDF